jgi:hypothetical protein
LGKEREGGARVGQVLIRSLLSEKKAGTLAREHKRRD